MKLSEILPHLKIAQDAEIKKLVSNSKEVSQGSAFFAIKGAHVNGNDFIDAAITAGAVAIIYDGADALKNGVTFIHSDNVRQDLTLTASHFFAPFPERIAGVTGTSGKTSSAKFVYDIYRLLKKNVGYTGTIGTMYGDKFIDGLTTPEPVDLFSEMHEMKKTGVEYLAMEVSSQGLDQYRTDGINFKVAAFTNLSRDHIDYHETMEQYFLSKLRFFSEVLPEDGIAVLNADVPEFEKLRETVTKRGARIWSYGASGKEIKLLNSTRRVDGQDLEFEVFGKKYSLATSLVGDFQAYNLMTAIGMAAGLEEGHNIEEIMSILPQLKNADGRLELVGSTKNGANVYVDYAHKPEALEKVINNLRPYTKNKLVVLFGAGGNRDKGKRPMMGKIACELADLVIVTDDNPRYEEPSTIRAEIMAACNEKAIEVGERHLAIEKGVSMLSEGDVFLIAGKGHETGQKIGDQVFHFNDKEEALEAIKKQP